MDESIAGFLADLAAGRGFSPRTVDAYRRDLTGWTEFLRGRHGAVPEVAAIQPSDVALYLARLTKDGRSARTVARHLSAIRSLAKYLRRHGHPADWTATLKGPRLPRPVPSFLTEAQTGKLFRLDFGDGAPALRDRAVLELFYATGIRLAELVGLNRDDSVDLGSRQVRVVGKGNRERIVPFGQPAARALEAYRSETDGDVVADRNGRPFFLGRGGQRVSRRTVQRLVGRHLSRVAQRAGLSPHILRHSVATHLLSRMNRSGAADIRVVQEFLGHVSLASTQVYTHVTVDRLRAALRASHPRGEK